MSEPDFYLIANEAVPIVYPIKCWVLKKLECKERDDFFLVKVEPQVLYYDSQERILELRRVVLVARHEGKTMANIKEWPIYVNLMKLNRDLGPDTYKLENEDFTLIAIGEIYPSVKKVWQEVKKAFE